TQQNPPGEWSRNEQSHLAVGKARQEASQRPPNPMPLCCNDLRYAWLAGAEQFRYWHGPCDNSHQQCLVASPKHLLHESQIFLPHTTHPEHARGMAGSESQPNPVRHFFYKQQKARSQIQSSSSQRRSFPLASTDSEITKVTRPIASKPIPTPRFRGELI